MKTRSISPLIVLFQNCLGNLHSLYFHIILEYICQFLLPPKKFSLHFDGTHIEFRSQFGDICHYLPILSHGMSHLFRFSQFSVYKFFTSVSLFKCIKWMEVLKVSCLDSSLLVYKKTIGICILILYPVALLNLFVHSSSWFFCVWIYGFLRSSKC